MDFGTIFKAVTTAISVINTVQSGLSNEAVANTIKGLIPGDWFAQAQAWAGSIFDKVKPALQVVAAVQTTIDPNKNKTIQGMLNLANEKMGLGQAPLVVDGIYGPKTKAMALAVQQKLGGDVVADGWVGQITLAALEIYMNKVA